MNSPITQDKSLPNLISHRLIFIGTLAMTYLTFAKELVWFQNERHNPLVLLYLVAAHLYYPLLILNFAVLAGMVILHFRSNHRPFLLLAACALFIVNVAIFSSNNILNWMEGKPLHRRHQGIGW